MTALSHVYIHSFTAYCQIHGQGIVKSVTILRFLDLKDNEDKSLHLRRKYARIFVLELLSRKNCSLFGTDNVRGQISEHIFAPNGDYCLFIHQIFSLASNWSKHGMWLSENCSLLGRDKCPRTDILAYFRAKLRLLFIYYNAKWRLLCLSSFKSFLQHAQFW